MAAQVAQGSSGYTEEEAKEFHAGYMRGFIAFIIVAVIAHILVWQWRPWLGPGA
jgi:light-harvesting complex 1 beta chain